MNYSRRELLSKGGIGIAATVGLAGCSSSGSSGDSGGGGSDSGGDASQYPDWDSENPKWPQPAARLYEDNFQFGTEAALESMEERDKPFHGNAPEQITDDTEIIDPDPLVFSIAPDESSSVYRDAFSELINNIEEETGKTVEFQGVNSKAAMVEAMRSERLHIAGFSTGNTAFAVNLAGAQPFGMMLQENGTFGYRLFVVARQDNEEVNSLEDLGKYDQIPHTSETSNSGNQAPRALFEQQGLVPGEDYEVIFSGGHEQSVLGVVNEDYPAAPTCSGCPKRFANQDLLSLDNIKVVWASQSFPTRGFSYRYNLDPDLKESIRTAHYDYDYAGTGMDTELDLGTQFTELDYATHWHTILVIQKSNGVNYQEGV
jgi:phosphonate transport system substrate-binding protein